MRTTRKRRHVGVASVKVTQPMPSKADRPYGSYSRFRPVVYLGEENAERWYSVKSRSGATSDTAFVTLLLDLAEFDLKLVQYFTLFTISIHQSSHGSLKSLEFILAP